MGIPKDYFRKLFGSKKVAIKVFGCEIRVSPERLGQKLDFAQDVLDAQVWQDVQTYMPMNTGSLIKSTDDINKTTRGEVYLYPPEHDYGHYQYEGIKYVDPVYGIGAFYTPEYGYWSRPGIEKVASEEFLFYSKPTAEAHWGEVAMQNQKEQWVKVAKRALKKG